jgi:hypothetical protein
MTASNQGNANLRHKPSKRSSAEHQEIGAIGIPARGVQLRGVA